MRYIEGVNRKRKIAFPEYWDDYITENNPVRVIEAFVDSLDLEVLGFKIAKFRKQNKESIQNVFHQLVRLCKDWDLFGMEIVAVDGSKFRAY